jgi:hypothetical protein
VTLLHEGFSADLDQVDRYADHGRGWTGFMCNLKTFIERDWDMREGAPPKTLP